MLESKREIRIKLCTDREMILQKEKRYPVYSFCICLFDFSETLTAVITK